MSSVLRFEASEFRISELLKETVRDAPTLLGYTPKYRTFLESRRARDQRRVARPSAVRTAVVVDDEPYVVGPTADGEAERARRERKERKRA